MKIERIAEDCVSITVPENTVHIEDGEAVIFLTRYDALNWSDYLYVETTIDLNTPETIEAEIGQEWVLADQGENEYRAKFTE